MGDSLVLGHVHYFLHVNGLLYFTLDGHTDRWEMGTKCLFLVLCKTKTALADQPQRKGMWSVMAQITTTALTPTTGGFIFNTYLQAICSRNRGCGHGSSSLNSASVSMSLCFKHKGRVCSSVKAKHNCFSSYHFLVKS